MQEMMQPLSKDHKEIMGALLESVKTDKLQNAFNKYLPSVLKEDAKKPEKKVLSESSTEVTGNKAEASASVESQTADIVYSKLVQVKEIQNGRQFTENWSDTKAH